MLTAILSDIHANREAFDACFADAKKRGAERFAFLGDLVGYGADPAYVVDRIADLQAAGALVVQGNHDAAVMQNRESMNRHARAAIDWTRWQLDETQKRFLAGLPLTTSLGELLFVHAEASHPAEWIYIAQLEDAERSIAASGARITVSGHLHRPHLFHKPPQSEAACYIPESNAPIELADGAQWHAIIGAVGQPRDHNPAAAYALYDDRSKQFCFARVGYDIERAARKIKAAGLPPILSARLYIGR